MKKTFFFTLAALLFLSLQAVAQKDFLPFGQFTKQPWTAKYYFASNNESDPAENWMAADFDDSSWGDIDGPIGIDDDMYYATEWQNYYSTYWVRRHFQVDNIDDMDAAIFYIRHDDTCEAYLNGNLIYNKTSYISNYTTIGVTEIVRASLKVGENVLAVKVSDTAGGTAFMDFGMTGYPNITANVAEPGTLGDVILGQTENFSDVRSLTITGTLNNADISTLQTRLTNLQKLDMSGVRMTDLPSEMFSQRRILEEVKLPSILTNIGNYAFYRCTNLKKVEFPNSLKSIGNYAFQECGMTQIVLPEGLTSIGNYAFYSCTSNKYLKLPSTLSTIATQTFRDNSNLEKIDFAEGLTNIESSAFENCGAITELKFPNTLYYIGNNAFYRNNSLKEISFNEGLYQIGDNAFYGCNSLTEVTLPSTLVLAYASPFDYCNNLVKVTCLSLEPPYMEDQIPYGISMDGRELYVPALSINTYKQTTGWDKFPTIKPIDYLPENINVLSDLRLTLPEELPMDYKPNVSLIQSNKGGYYWQNGSLTVNGDGILSMSKFLTTWDYDYQYDYSDRPQNYCSLYNNSNLRADDICVQLFTKNDRWTFLSFPFNVKVSEIEANRAGATNWIIRKYNGVKRAAGETDSTWEKMTADDVLQAGEGYIIQSSRYIDNSWQQHSGFLVKAVKDASKNNIFTAKDVTVALNEYQSEFMHNRSWNLIGNPYPCYYDTRFMDFTAPITVWNIRNNTYEAYSPVDDSYILCPGEAFFVQRPIDNGNIVFAKEGRQTNRTARNLEVAKVAPSASGNERSVFNLTITDGIQTDRTRVVINGNASMEYEMEKDASKFMSSDENAPQIFTTNNGIDYAINERPLADGKANLSVRTNNTDALYTIALDKCKDNVGYQLVLIDNLLGKRTVLTNGESYTFSADMSQVQSSRFSLLWGDGVTSIDEVKDASVNAGNTYTLDGKKVENTNQKGVYIQKGKKVIRK